MSVRRRRSGFEQAGAFPGERLPFPARRRRELKLALAWRSVAGAAIAARAPVSGMRAGSLIIETADPDWARTLRELLPKLGARLARRFPDFGIRRCRLVFRDPNGACGETIALAPLDEDESSTPPESPACRADTTPTFDEDVERRLEELGARLVARRARRQKP